VAQALTSTPRDILHLGFIERDRLAALSVKLEFTTGALLTMRYRVFMLKSVSTRISLHKNPYSFRPLLAFTKAPSLISLRMPMYRVGAVRSSRLSKVERYKDCHRPGLSPLPDPEILRYSLERFPTFLIPDRLVDLLKNFFRGGNRFLDRLVLVPGFGVMQDL
jgi:hypothetical protein